LLYKAVESGAPQFRKNAKRPIASLQAKRSAIGAVKQIRIEQYAFEHGRTHDDKAFVVSIEHDERFFA
jgi:hypothetical protein